MNYLFTFRKVLLFVILINITYLLKSQSTPIPVDSTVLIGKLENGLTFYIQKNAKPEKRIELRLAVNSGSVQEDENQLGLAHFCEHMCFNGTTNFPKNDIIHYLQSVGVNFGPEINGYTSFDETVYILTLPSDSVKIVDNGFKIMSEWASGVSFDTSEINKERGVILEEWRLGRGAWQRMRDKYLPVILKGSKYANRLPIGTKESIQGCSFDALKKYYKDWYRPDLMAFIVVGDIEPDSAKHLINKYFKNIQKPENARIKESFSIEDNNEPIISIVSDKENTSTNVMIAFKTPKIEVKTLDDLTLSLQRGLFLMMLNERLYEISKKENTPFLNANVGFGDFFSRTKMSFTASANVKEDSVITGLRAVLTEIERVKRYGFTQAELDRVKRSNLSGVESAYKERNKRESGNLVWQNVNHFLNNEPMPHISFYRNFVNQKYPEISLQDVNKWANFWIKDSNRVVVVRTVEKEAVKLPLEADIKNVMESIKTAKIDPYKEKVLAKDLIPENKMPKPGKITSEEKIGTKNITELKLSNGLTVVFKPTDFKNDEIIMSAFSEGGTSYFGKEYKLASWYASNIVVQGGISEYSLIDLNKMLSGKNVSVNPYCSQLYSGFSGYSTVADLETMFQLIYLYFTDTRRDIETYHAFVQRAKEQYKNALSNPVSYFFNEVNKILYKDCPEIPFTFPVEEDWNQLSIDKAYEIYKRDFSNASNFTFTFVGSFNPDTLKDLAKKYLATLPTQNKKETYVDKKIRPVQGPLNEKIFKGTDPKSYVVLRMNTPAKWSKVNAHLVWSMSNILNRIFIDKLREELSGVYGFGIYCELAKEPYENFNFSMTIPCAPENTDKLVQAVYTEIERIKKDGLTAEEFKKEVESQRRSMETAEKENNMWVVYLDLVLKTEKEYGRIEKPYELCEMMSPELIKEMANKFLDTSKINRITLYPENYQTANAQK